MYTTAGIRGKLDPKSSSHGITSARCTSAVSRSRVTC